MVYLNVSSAFLAAMFCSNLTQARSLSLGVARMVARSGSVLAVRVMYCTVLYCNVLYCTVLYCTILLFCSVLYFPLMTSY